MTTDGLYPIRSADLYAKGQRGVDALARAVAAINAAEIRADRAGLALHAVRPQPTPDVRAGVGEQGFWVFEATPTPSAVPEGPSLVSTRTEIVDALYTQTGDGEIDLFRPYELWAGLFPTREVTVSARVRPSYVVRYNELVIPHVAGAQTWRLARPDGGEDVYEVANRGRVFRFPTERLWNGALAVDSVSSAGVSGEWVHAMGGVTLRRASWLDTFTVRGRRAALPAGTFGIDAVRSRPGLQTADSFAVLVDGTPVDASGFTITTQQVVTVEAVFSGLVDVSELSVSVTRTA